MRCKLAYKILVQLIEADVEIGFALVDEAKAYRAWGRPDCSSRVLQVAEERRTTLNVASNDWATANLGPFVPLLPSCAMNLLRFDAKPPDSAFSYSLPPNRAFRYAELVTQLLLTILAFQRLANSIWS
jgi:hypothetical protein